MAILAALVAAFQLVLADVLAEHLDRADAFLDDLLAARAWFVHDLLARLAITEVAVVVAVVTARKLFSAFFVAVRNLSTTLNWGWDDLVSTGTAESLIDHDGALTTLASVALLWAWVATTL